MYNQRDYSEDMNGSESPSYAEFRNDAAKRLIVTPFSNITSRRIKFIWEPFIASRKITMFAGQPGKGKSQMLALIAAGVSTGAKLPSGMGHFPKGKVAMLSAEDSADDTIRPRLLANSADLDRVTDIQATSHLDAAGKRISGVVRLDEDLELISQLLGADGEYSLVIIDPISAYLGNVNENSNAELRGLMSKIDMLANKHNVAFVLNTHLNKNIDAGNATARIIGSVAYGAAARMVVIFTDHPDAKDQPEDGRCVFQCCKNNLAPKGHGLIYEIEPVLIPDQIMDEAGNIKAGMLQTSRIKFTGDIYEGTADSLVVKSKERSSPKTEECIGWLRQFLINGPMPLTDIRGAWERQGESASRLYSAKKKMNLIEDVAPAANGQKKITFWSLP